MSTMTGPADRTRRDGRQLELRHALAELVGNFNFPHPRFQGRRYGVGHGSNTSTVVRVCADSECDEVGLEEIRREKGGAFTHNDGIILWFEAGHGLERKRRGASAWDRAGNRAVYRE